MRIHLVRHGETRHNVEGRIQGDVLDDPLNETGALQAAALARHYASERAQGLRVAAVYASPLKRAYETAAAVARALELPAPSPLPGLREISWGRYNGQDNVGPIREDMTRILTAWDRGELSAHAPEGETPGEAWTRASKDLAPLLERHAADEIVVVGHGRINKVVASGLVHGHLHQMEGYPQANAGVTVLEGPMPWRVATLNSTAHLGDLRALDERHS